VSLRVLAHFHLKNQIAKVNISQKSASRIPVKAPDVRYFTLCSTVGELRQVPCDNIQGSNKGQRTSTPMPLTSH
jgi:hypothetical protein